MKNDIVLPSAVAAALLAGREELMNNCIERVRSGEILPQDQVVGLLCAMQQVIKDRAVLRANCDELLYTTRAVTQFLSGLDKKAGELEDIEVALRDGTPYVRPVKEEK